jgi:ABC-type glycerol-3-phosphate transport system substrate-binding protein
LGKLRLGNGPALPAFYKEHPDIQLEWVQIAWEPHHQALQTALAAGTGAHDIDMVEAAYIAQFRESTAVENFKDPPYNAERYKNDFVGYKWNQGYSSDGKRLMAIPWDMGPLTFYYRADVFEELMLRKSAIIPHVKSRQEFHCPLQ